MKFKSIVRWSLSIVLAVGIVNIATSGPLKKERPFDPYQRAKNGPPLTHIMNKVNRGWLFGKLKQPRHHAMAVMPKFLFSDSEVIAMMAYFKSIAGKKGKALSWPAWVSKKEDDMTDPEADALEKLMQLGKNIWGKARCTICHSVNGPRNTTIGGYVDLRVGGRNLSQVGSKVKRRWLYSWLKDPKNYYPESLMPRFRLTEKELRGLVEYLLRGEPFSSKRTLKPPKNLSKTAWSSPKLISYGKLLLERARCVTCHEIQGLTRVLPRVKRTFQHKKGSFNYLIRDMRCLTCHPYGKQGGTYAPDLATVGSRLKGKWIATFLHKIDMLRPLSQQMPDLLMSKVEAQTLARSLSLLYRSTKIPQKIPGGAITSQEVKQGRKLFYAKGCLACHNVGEGAGGAVGPGLQTVGDRLHAGYIWYHLRNPHAIHPHSPEPNYHLTKKEARVLAAYLSTKRKKR